MNELAGFQAFQAQLRLDAHCVMEARGPYYLRLATYLHQAGIVVWVVNSLIIKGFSQMKLSWAKTDKADAKLIADYAALHQPPLWQPRQAFISELQQESRLLEQLTKQGTISQLGMAQMCKLLYLCVWSAARYSQTCRQLYQRLLEKGKAKKLALVDLANKLLQQAFAMATCLTPYQTRLTKQNLETSSTNA